ncbi:MAG: hypothetical protein ACOY0T_29930 [Myxococcota bacterium]
MRVGLATRAARFALAAAVLVWLILLGAFAALLAPMLRDFSTYGFHDWDAHAAYRYITTLSLRQYGEGPWWHPWLCGGVPAWGYVEGAPNLVSPYLPFYLWADIRAAIRVEVIGNGLIGLAGAYTLARHFTRSRALAGFFAALFVLNGRWALQTAVGHTWHLQYAITPWVFYCFERALSERGDFTASARRFALTAGALLAYLVYAGGIYPLPHTALFLVTYASLRALFACSLRPLPIVALAGIAALALAAPKLLAVLDYMQGTPRLIDSNERIGLGELWVMLTQPNQAYGMRPVSVPAYNWHEWGIYVGTAGLAFIGLGALFARGQRGQAFKICGIGCLLLGLGDFHAYAPWRLLHRLPPFSSQHVPSRFHYLMVFFLGLACVIALAPRLERWLKRRPWLDLVLLLPLALYVRDLVNVNQRPFEQAFWMRAPDNIPALFPFEHHRDAPVSYVQRDWAAPMLLAMFANTGVIRCYGADPSLKVGAVAADAPNYEGNAFVADGPGRAEIIEWTPNRASVRVRGAEEGALVVYNMNYDVSWRADGAPALEVEGRVAARLLPGRDSIEFSYFPRTLKYSLPIFLLSIGLVIASGTIAARIGAYWRRFVRRRARNESATDVS